MLNQHEDSVTDVPGWVKDAIFYQIFPDRFAKSKEVPKPANLEEWDAPPSYRGYHGGDLLGVVEHLDYLEDLGVNALYLNPIFQSAANHRYHTHDYFQVDPLLGGNAALRTLVEEAHRRDIRIILDGVFNHASRGFFQFNDILENGPDSPWVHWFLVEDWPLAPYDEERPANYTSWWGIRALPKFNTDNPQVREFLMQVGEYWIREYDIDGWRLDVPQEITTTGFWEEFRQRVKGIKVDAYLVGEVWHEAREWLQGDRFDAVMNYPLAAAVIAFTAGNRVSPKLVDGRSYEPYPGIDASEFGRRIRRLIGLYDWEIIQAQFNLLDSHDTARLISLARGDKATIRLATLFLMTYPGTPCIYYGDEIGLRGTEDYDEPHQDPDARWPFPWHLEGDWDRELLSYFRATIALRKSHPTLRHGSFDELAAEDECYAFARHDGRESLLVLLNAGENPATFHLPVGDYFADGQLLSPIFGRGQVGAVVGEHITISAEPRQGVVLAG